MLEFTLDTELVVAIDEQRPEATAIRAIADAYAWGPRPGASSILETPVAVVGACGSTRETTVHGRYVTPV